MKVNAISASETAYYLRYKLGDVRAWDHLLADMRRGRASYHGEILLPVGRYSATRHPRPIYLFSEVCEFVEKASRLCPLAAKPHMLAMREIDIDFTDKRHWSARPPLMAH
ncbi:hypothetical protein SM868_003982 [Yersinia enterocolitica]|nr:hypothetical protein [Yersinia enterocolitica]